jgi:hypothetical protein
MILSENLKILLVNYCSYELKFNAYSLDFDIPNVFVPISRNGYNGLILLIYSAFTIEGYKKKTPKADKYIDLQIEFIKNDYAVKFVKELDKAKKIIEDYISILEDIPIIEVKQSKMNSEEINTVEKEQPTFKNKAFEILKY